MRLRLDVLDALADKKSLIFFFLFFSFIESIASLSLLTHMLKGNSYARHTDSM